MPQYCARLAHENIAVYINYVYFSVTQIWFNCVYNCRVHYVFGVVPNYVHCTSFHIFSKHHNTILVQWFSMKYVRHFRRAVNMIIWKYRSFLFWTRAVPRFCLDNLKEILIILTVRPLEIISTLFTYYFFCILQVQLLLLSNTLYTNIFFWHGRPGGVQFKYHKKSTDIACKLLQNTQQMRLPHAIGNQSTNTQY